MALAVAEAAAEAGLRIVLLPAAYHRGGWDDGSDLPPAPGQRRFCDPDVDTFLSRVDALRRVGGVGAGRRGRDRRAQRARGPAQLARGDRVVLGPPRRGPSHPRARAAPRARRVPGRARLLPDRAARANRVPRGAGQRDPRHPRVGARTSRSWLAQGRRSCPARPPRETWATATYRRWPTPRPASRWPSAATRRSGSTRSRRRASSRPARAASASSAPACWPRSATCGPSCAVTATAAWVSTGEPAGIEIDLEHPDLSGVDSQDLPLALVTCASAGVVRAGGP